MNLFELRMLGDLFYSVFPVSNFILKVGDLRIQPSFGVGDRKIIISSPDTLFHITHEMAHVIETPNARIFDVNFGLKFPEYIVVGKDIKTNPEHYKTLVPFKRELRVFGIQASLLHLAKIEFGFSDQITRRDEFVALVKSNLIGTQTFNSGLTHSRYIPASIRNTTVTELYSLVNQKIFEYSERYHHTKLPQILKRKFDYVEKHR